MTFWSGNVLVARRLVTVTIFKLVRLVFTAVQRVYWKLNGTAEKLRQASDPQNYQHSAHVLDVLMFHKFSEGLYITLDDVLCVHNRFESPQYIIDNEHVSLMTINDQHAVFSVAQEPGMLLWRAKYAAFSWLSHQYYTKQLIVVPISVFHQMSETIGDPEAELIFIFNTGRCGSTLLTQAFECTGRCVAISEPNPLKFAETKYRQHGDTTASRQCARDAVRWVCRPYPKSFDQPVLAYVAKMSASSVTAFPIFRTLYPNSRCLFMYRDIVNTAKSFYRMSFALPSLSIVFSIMRLPGPLVAATLRAMGIDAASSFHFERMENGLTFGVFFTATTMRTYLDLRKGGCEIAGVRYEDLVGDPSDACRRILEYCGLPVGLVESAVRSLQIDSQAKSFLSREALGRHPEPAMTPAVMASVDRLLRKYDLPGYGEACILEGTITHTK